MTLVDASAAASAGTGDRSAERSDRPGGDRSHPLRLHVERTRSERVLRWVCHRPDLVDDVTPPPESALARAISGGRLRAAVGRDGDLYVDFGDPDALEDPIVVRGIHDAVVSSLANGRWEATASVTPVQVRRR